MTNAPEAYEEPPDSHQPTLHLDEGQDVRLANSKAGIKPTAPLSVFDKKNSIEFPLDFSILLIQLLHDLCTPFPCQSCDIM